LEQNFWINVRNTINLNFLVIFSIFEAKARQGALWGFRIVSTAGGLRFKRSILWVYCDYKLKLNWVNFLYSHCKRCVLSCSKPVCCFRFLIVNCTLSTFQLVFIINMSSMMCDQFFIAHLFDTLNAILYTIHKGI
jgi:hypothetical protein